MHEARNSYETGRKREHKYWPTDKLECFVCGWIYLSPLKADIGSSNKISSDTDTLWADTLHPQQSRYIMPRDFIAVFPSKYHALRPFRRTRWLIPVSDRSIEANFTVPSGYRYIRVCVCVFVWSMLTGHVIIFTFAPIRCRWSSLRCKSQTNFLSISATFKLAFLQFIGRVAATRLTHAARGSFPKGYRIFVL